jgi:hypothetical protein
MSKKSDNKKTTFGIDLVEGLKLVLAHERGRIQLEEVWPNRSM